MIRHFKEMKFIARIASSFVIGIFFSTSVLAVTPPPFAASNLPGPARPDVPGQAAAERAFSSAPKSQAAIKAQPQPASSLGPESEKIKFKLTKIIIEGNTVYSTQQLSALYKDKLNTTISIADLVKIVQDITNYYRNNGYILSRAVLPPQHVAGGAVTVRVLEGYIDEVKIAGTPKKAQYIIQRYVNNVTHSRPLQLSVLEHYLRLSNQISGVNVRAVLEPSKTQLAASTLNLVAETQTFVGFISYDNYGSLYSGPNEVSGSAGLNSMVRSGDILKAFYVTTSRPKELRYIDLSYATPIGPKGLQFLLDGNRSNTRPGLNLRQLKINGLSNIYMGSFSYPIILSRATDLTVNGDFNYIDSGVTSFGTRLYMDHIRTIRGGVTLNHADQWRGTNSFNAYVEQGLNIIGATDSVTSTTTSRYGGEATGTKIDMTASRLQTLTNVLGLYMLAKGQFAFNPLLSSEQFSYGGSQLGRGYDAADIIGDLGLAGSLELRVNATPGWFLLTFFQPYIFYDGGIIWNRRNLPGSSTKQSETSTGGGVRFLFTKNLSGNLMVGQPLTKQDNAEEIRGNGRRLRGFFSVTLSV